MFIFLNRYYSNSPALFSGFLFPLSLFLFSLLLRILFFSGFILSDDAEEFGLLESLNHSGPSFQGYLQYRFSLWIFNLLFFKIFGISEASFFAPTFLMSASLCVIAYYILLRLNYSVGESFFGGLFVASAPFEVLIGSLRANDLILSWFMALALLAYFTLKDRPVSQGLWMSLFFWFAFYDKIWTVFFLPALGLYYALAFYKDRQWKGAVSFAGGSLALHLVSSLFWLKKMGVLIPYISVHPPTFPVEAKDLPDLWARYPGFLFKGSEFGSTLFGWVPYLLILLLCLKLGLTLFGNKEAQRFRLDRTDIGLLVYYLSFFLLLEFFPNTFKFDQYYSSPRIFRYLTPVSFPMALHLGKMILDLMRSVKGLNFSLKPASVFVLMAGLLSINFIQASAATEPGRNYREALKSIESDLRQFSGGTVYVESWLGFFLRQVYFRNERDRFQFIVNLEAHKASDYEVWLKEIQPAVPEGTFLITGIGSNVHYGGHYDGFRLEFFSQPLDPGWKLVGDYGKLRFLPRPEKARLWTWKNLPETQKPLSGGQGEGTLENKGPEELFSEGMKKFDRGACSEGEQDFSTLIDTFPAHHLADDGYYFRTICAFSKGRWMETIEGFQHLLDSYPESTWAAGAHYHIGLSLRHLGKKGEAKSEFEFVIENYPADKTLTALSKTQIKELK